jgi:hypothetical protein
MRIGDPRGKYASNVEITLRDGRRFSSGVMSGGTDYSQNWDKEQVEHKFRRLVGYVLPQRRTDELMKLVWGFDHVPHVALLTELVQRANS